MQRRRVLFLESFFGGSHRAVAEGLARHSQHSIDLYTLPAENWRWRIRTGALRFTERLAAEQGKSSPLYNPDARPVSLDNYDVILATDIISISDLRALTNGAPILLYMHESQITYPLPQGQTLDADTLFLDIRNALLADRLTFNSVFHRNRFFEEVRSAYSRAPEDESDMLSERLISTLEARSAVLYPGCELGGLVPSKRTNEEASSEHTRVPLIIWNHRWQFDKNPAPFFRTLERLSLEGWAFRVALLGESSQVHPREFEAAQRSLAHHIVHAGYIEDRAAYERVLASGDVVVSTSIQENFGISIVEATAAGCLPLLPARLSYPEIIPAEYHELCLYESNLHLTRRLRTLLRDGVPRPPGLIQAMRRFDWQALIAAYDREINEAAGAPREQP
ncbi:MAG: DUF3524 domain-containing protein [Spirochaetaceae bacterium]